MQTILTPEAQSPEFNLSSITKFNPALIYGFDTEASIKNYYRTSTAYLEHGVKQWQDMFAAYYYAEFTILPAIQGLGVANISPKQLMQWLNDLH